MKPIHSILDTDQYKITMQNAVLDIFPEAYAKYRFINRGKQRFNREFVNKLTEQVYGFSEVSLTKEECIWLEKTCPYLKPWYFDYLMNYRFNPEQVKIELSEDANLIINIEGKWHETILWEVPLMATISELYFEVIDTNWDMVGQREKAKQKAESLCRRGCRFTDFGARRRRNYKTQDLVMEEMKGYDVFMGTSNMHFAMKHNVKPIGSYAHEWIQGNAVLESLQHADYYAMNNWGKVFQAKLGIALTDTYGFKSFLRNFNLRFAKLFDGIRNDSGNVFEFTDMAVEHYRSLGIDPLSKFIIFSNALDVKKAIEIKNYCQGKINCSFGIGTHFSNDFENSPALNMVIKLNEINAIPTVKLSDDLGKEMGDRDAIKVMKWIHKREPLI